MIRILNASLEVIETITEYVSVEFEKVFNDYGTFTIQLPKTSASENVQKNRIVRHKGNFGIIKYISESEKGVVIKGYDLKYILAQRVATSKRTGYAETVIKSYVRDIAGTSEARRFKLLSAAKDKKRGMSNTAHTIDGAEMLSDTVREICASQDWGYDIEVKDGGMVFDIKIPTTHEYVYSRRRENIKSIEYTLDALNEKNMAYNIDADGSTTWIYDTEKTDFERAECITNESDVTNTAKTAVKKQLSESVSESVEAEILSPNDYGTAWNLGDFVKLRCKILGGEITVTKQITAVTEVWEAGTHRVTPTFGKEKESVFRKILRGRA